MISRVRFGLFDFDPASRSLLRDGVPVRLQAQPMQVLSVLVEHAGEVVTRDQLRQAVWGTETFVDFDRGLNYCITQIRSALGDSAESPRFIRTVPKLGYQFIAPVTATAPAQPAPPESRVPHVGWRHLSMAFAAMLVAGGVVFAVLAAHRPPVNIAVARFDNETGNPAMDSFADGLTDSLVAELAAADRRKFGIIGNASLLRQPRQQRDLRAIGSSLNAAYVVLGQVQRGPSQVRVLAHLIQLPQQTHVAAVRLDRDISDPLQTQSELARLISVEFLTKLGASPWAVTR